MAIRLGYACVNTQLPSTSRTTRLANATPDRLLELAESNLAALEAILRWNVEHRIEVFRVSSGIVPFGGHPINTTNWDEQLAPQFAQLAELVRANPMQLSTHPGQFVVLGAPREAVVAASLADLEYHARLFRALELGLSHGIVIHVGGAYDDRAAAVERLARAIDRLSPDARARLRLENDERWPLDETLVIASRLDVPVVFDVFHHELNPSFPGASTAELVELARGGWRGPQELHFSTQDPDKRAGAHAQTVDVDAFAAFAEELEGIDADCILEVKDKERSLLKVRDRLYTDAL